MALPLHQPLDVGGRRDLAGERRAPSWMRASKGCIDPRRASIDIAAAMSAARASARRRRAPAPSTAVDGCVPLISARPSFGAERDRREAGAPQRLGA